MSDIVPVEPPKNIFADISLGNDFARWGRLFGDDQVAALVAIASSRNGDADLILLLWKNGWHFAQYVGKIPAFDHQEDTADWTIEATPSTTEYYLVSGLGLYPPRNHRSWRFDPQTHRLLPVDWPSNAIPSFIDDTITFASQEKPGYSPLIREIHRFSKGRFVKLGTIIDSVTTIWSDVPSKTVTWKIQKTSQGYDYRAEIYTLSQFAGDQAVGTPTEEASLTFNWEGSSYPHDTRFYILKKLTELSANVLAGQPAGEIDVATAIPLTIKVTGSPKIRDLFEWQKFEHPK